MLFKIVKITSDKNHNDLFNLLSGTDEIESVLDDSNELLYFNYKNDFEMNIVPLIFNGNFLFLFNTFENRRIDIFRQWFEGIANSSFSVITFTNDSFKEIIDGDCKIVEMTAIIHDSVTDEISISGSDLKTSEFYTSIIEKGEIKKLVLYLDYDENLNALMKIFYDGRISIIPEFEFKRVKSLVTYVLERLEIE